MKASVFLWALLFVFKKIASNISKYIIVIKGKSINLSRVESALKSNLNSFLCKGKYFDKEKVELIYDVRYKGKQDDRVVKELFFTIIKMTSVFGLMYLLCDAFKMSFFIAIPLLVFLACLYNWLLPRIIR